MNGARVQGSWINFIPPGAIEIGPREGAFVDAWLRGCEVVGDGADSEGAKTKWWQGNICLEDGKEPRFLRN